MIERIIFGCSRIYGYAGQYEANKLIRAAYEAGIRRFDVAPSYGFGTAEAALRIAFRGLPKDRDSLQVVIKAGSTKSLYGLPLTCIRSIKRAFKRFPNPLGVSHRYVNVDSCSGMNFESRFLWKSIERSCRLICDGVSADIVLHEVHCGDLNEELREFAVEARRRGILLGYSHSGVFNPRIDSFFDPGGTRQLALQEDWLTAPPDIEFHGSVNIHSALKVISRMKSQNREIGDLAKELGSVLQDYGFGLEFQDVILALWSVKLAGSKVSLIWTSSNSERILRLGELLALMKTGAPFTDDVDSVWSEACGLRVL